MRTIVVTGAARGIGRAIAERMLSEECRVIGNYNAGADEAHELIATFGDERVMLAPADFTDRSQTQAFVDFVRSKTDRVDGLVLNAGIIEFALFDATTEAQWDNVLEVNLTASWLLAHELSSLLQPKAAVIAISSTDAFTASYASIGYTVSKAALVALMNCLAAVLGERQIRCIPLCAGWVDSGMSTDESYEAATLTPLGRNGKPEDIAAVVSFLMSDGASFINGSPLIVDGGYGLIDYIVKKEADALATRS